MSFARSNPASVCAVLCVMTACLAGVGCGKSDHSSSKAADTSSRSAGSTGETTATAPSTTAGRFIAEADAICRKANVQLVKSKLKPKGTATAVAAVVVENETTERKALGELTKLTPPSAIAPTWAKMIDLRRSLANGLGDYAAAIRRGETTFTAIGKAKKRLKAELTAAGGKAGFKDCAKIG